MIYVTSDQHLGNHNIWAKYCTESRPFSSQEEHDNIVINRWNNVVLPGDVVYVVGDFVMGQKENIDKFVPRLNGDIRLIRGNHDPKNRDMYYERNGVVDIEEIAAIKYEGIRFILVHNKPEDMHGDENTVILYGHIHDKAPKGLQPDWTYHVGCDTNALTPVGLHEIYHDVMIQRIEMGF